MGIEITSFPRPKRKKVRQTDRSVSLLTLWVKHPMETYMFGTFWIFDTNHTVTVRSANVWSVWSVCRSELSAGFYHSKVLTKSMLHFEFRIIYLKSVRQNQPPHHFTGLVSTHYQAASFRNQASSNIPADHNKFQLELPAGTWTFLAESRKTPEIDVKLDRELSALEGTLWSACVASLFWEVREDKKESESIVHAFYSVLGFSKLLSEKQIGLLVNASGPGRIHKLNKSEQIGTVCSFIMSNQISGKAKHNLPAWTATSVEMQWCRSNIVDSVPPGDGFAIQLDGNLEKFAMICPWMRWCWSLSFSFAVFFQMSSSDREEKNDRSLWWRATRRLSILRCNAKGPEKKKKKTHISETWWN